MLKRQRTDSSDGDDNVPRKTSLLPNKKELVKSSGQRRIKQKSRSSKNDGKGKGKNRVETSGKSKGPSTSGDTEGASSDVGSEEKFTFFWGKDFPFSQFHPCIFTVDGVIYNCAEQYMMHQKAVMFGDKDHADKILASSNPKEQKAFGRKVTPFDKVVWGRQCQEVVAKGNYHKNKDLLDQLLSTKGTTMVEASPRDRLWGIGMGAKNPLALDRKNWRGKNLLGKVITEVREKIMKEMESKE